jgi:hypothetical protein
MLDRWLLQGNNSMADPPDSDIDKIVAERLREAGFKLATEKAIGGLAPDFIVYAADGRQFIVETRRRTNCPSTWRNGRRLSINQGKPISCART